MRHEEDFIDVVFEGNVGSEKEKMMNALSFRPGNRASFAEILADQVGLQFFTFQIRLAYCILILNIMKNCCGY